MFDCETLVIYNSYLQSQSVSMFYLCNNYYNKVKQHSLSKMYVKNRYRFDTVSQICPQNTIYKMAFVMNVRILQECEFELSNRFWNVSNLTTYSIKL